MEWTILHPQNIKLSRMIYITLQLIKYPSIHAYIEQIRGRKRSSAETVYTEQSSCISISMCTKISFHWTPTLFPSLGYCILSYSVGYGLSPYPEELFPTFHSTWIFVHHWKEELYLLGICIDFREPPSGWSGLSMKYQYWLYFTFLLNPCLNFPKISIAMSRQAWRSALGRATYW